LRLVPMAPGAPALQLGLVTTPGAAEASLTLRAFADHARAALAGGAA
jgi:hypothetical protein